MAVESPDSVSGARTAAEPPIRVGAEDDTGCPRAQARRRDGSTTTLVGDNDAVLPPPPLLDDAALGTWMVWQDSR
jgi:hypothetical protein